MNIAPSKGNFSRLIMPEDVPYTFNKTYQVDAFYPNDIIQLKTLMDDNEQRSRYKCLLLHGIPGIPMKILIKS